MSLTSMAGRFRTATVLATAALLLGTATATAGAGDQLPGSVMTTRRRSGVRA